MPIVRFDPPARPKTDLLSVARTIAGLYTAPIETVLSLATRGKSGRGDPIYMTAPVEVNTDTGRVAVEHLDKMKGKLAILDKVRNDARPGIQALLQTAYDTGVVPDALAKSGYKAVADQLAALSGQYQQQAYYNWPRPVDQVEQPEQSPIPQQGEPTWSETMPNFLPPGGMAGFNQMTGASKLALTGVRRRSKSSRKRKKSSAKKTRRTGARSRKRKSSKRKLVKGSAAAKRYMASIRKKRRG